METTKKVASNKILWIFAIGQLGWSTLAGIITNQFAFFYMPGPEAIAQGQEIFIPQGLFLGLTVIGIIFAIGRVFDAVTDPWIAGKSDRLHHKLGRRIPFMRAAALPFGIMTVLLFVAPQTGNQKLNAGILFVCAMLFYLLMTCYCTPYNALIPELGRTQKARINLSTFISVTYFVGTAFAFLVPMIAGMLRDSLGYANSYRVPIAVLAIVSVICMLVPAFVIDENEYADTTPSEVSAFASLAATFKNKHFRTFVGSDLFYWLGLTMFNTGLLYYVTELMGLPESSSTLLFIVMSVVSLCFYPLVNKLAPKLGKKKMIVFAFLFFSVTFLVTAFSGINPLSRKDDPTVVYGIIIAVLASLPMAILGILPNAVIADIAEYDKSKTGENRQGMFYAARTFAMKMGQAIGTVIFTSVASISPATGLGYRLTAFIATGLCLIGAAVFVKYNEKQVMETIEGSGDDADA